MTDALSELGLEPGAHLAKTLLNPEYLVEVGGIYRLDFERALVLTADKWKADAGGIPRFCFLLATARQGETSADADEVLLLRVDGVAELAQERDLLAVREEALRDALVSGRDPELSEVMFRLDPYTREQISFTGLDCRILGTFYEETFNGNPLITWGSDIDNFYASSTYRVYKPHGQVLSYLASFVRRIDEERSPRKVRIGAVRYASTMRRSIAAEHDDAAVEVNVEDFIGEKTGMFGMTRMGKSNTMKTIATQVFIAAAKSERKIGQLIFDPQGEYANPNTQDGTALAAIGEDYVRIYRFGARGAQESVRPLGINFFDERQLPAVRSLISDMLTSSGGTAGYVKDFLAAQLEDVSDDYGAKARASRARLLLYGSLIRAGFELPRTTPGTTRSFGVSVSMGQDLRDKVNAGLSGEPIKSLRAGYVFVRGEDIAHVIDWILEHGDDEDVEKFTDDVSWQSIVPIYTGASQGRQVRGFRNLIQLNSFHNPSTDRPLGDEIYQDLLAGRIVIVDLHLGPTDVITRLSEHIVLDILGEQLSAFTQGEAPPHVQVVVEEAHNLFTRESRTDYQDPWVKLAKEASKLKIGLVYATQEVSSVDRHVLANTKNWVVAHLNNTWEINELARFYDFSAFAESIARAEDKGYVRLKTESSPYIIPVHIDKFGPEMINEAREAAGLDEVQFVVGVESDAVGE